MKNILVYLDEEGNCFIYIRLTEETSASYNKNLPFNYKSIDYVQIITNDLSVTQYAFCRLKDIFKYQTHGQKGHF